ncbi:hypothetical protein EXM40_04365 [Clostridium botulinum]|nr:hypothetical protein [Clostridium botulinum]
MVDFIVAEQHLMNIFEGCLAYVNENLQREKNIQLDVKFHMDVEKQKIYASAGKRPEGGYIVKVSMATYNIIEEYYSTMICIKGFYNTMTLREEFNGGIAQNYSRILIDMTLRTIIFHELGHIFNGHIDYIQFKIDEYKKLHPEVKEINYIPEYLEKSKEARPYLTPIDWQALEWNADDFAITRLIGQYTYKDNIDGDILKTIDQAFFMITAAITSMYCLMDMNLAKDKDTINEYKLEEHLPKRFRLKKYCEVAVLATEKFNGIELFKGLNKEDYDSVIKRFEEWYVLYIKVKRGTLKEGEGLNEADETVENNKDELDDIHIDYYKKVDEYYVKNLPLELDGFTYFKVYL